MSGAALLPGLLATGVLLVWAGVVKLRQPDVAAAFLASLGFPVPRLLVLAGALLEIGAGGAVLFRPRLAAFAIALLFLLFAALVAARLRRQTGVPCGCLGAESGPASRVHLALNVVCAGLAGAAVVVPPPTYPSVATADPLGAVSAGFVAIWVAVLAIAAVDLLPETLGAWRGAEA